MKQAAKDVTSSLNEIRQHLAISSMWLNELNKADIAVIAVEHALKREADSSSGLDMALHCSEMRFDEALEYLQEYLEKACGAAGMDYEKSLCGAVVLTSEVQA